MNLFFQKDLASRYVSASQKARVLTEHWVDNQVYCPNCGNQTIDQYTNNMPVADFFCKNCNEDYELKSKSEVIGNKIVNGAYNTMIARISNSNNPNLFLLNYDLQNLKVKNFFVVPKHFFIPKIIEKRKPLSITAQRVGWVGCNILIQNIPQTGKIFYIKNGKIESKKKVLSEWKKTLFLREEKEFETKGWLLDVMRSIDKLGKREFTLDDVYAFEKELSKKHPENHHIKDKIRQQLQILRDKGYLIFSTRGRYRLT